MPSASGLSRDQRIRCRDRVVQAARLTLANKEHTHYTEGPLRWDGIKNRRNAEIGQFPEYSDCSSFATWCLWNGLVLRFGLGDVVNGAGWPATPGRCSSTGSRSSTPRTCCPAIA
jgi:hypothetical protein